MPAQWLFLAAVCVVALNMIRNRHTLKNQAWKKLAFSALLLLTVVAILHPGLTTDVAALLGIGRGADLLLYCTTLALLFHGLNTHLRFKDYELRLSELARAIALNDAEQRHYDRA